MLTKPQETALEKLATELFGECSFCDFLHFSLSTFEKLKFQPAKFPKWTGLHVALKYDKKDDIFLPSDATEETESQYRELKITNGQAAEFFRNWRHPKNPNPPHPKHCDIPTPDEEKAFQNDLQLALQSSLEARSDYYVEEEAAAPAADILAQQRAVSAGITHSDEQLEAMGLKSEAFAALMLEN